MLAEIAKDIYTWHVDNIIVEILLYTCICVYTITVAPSPVIECTQSPSSEDSLEQGQKSGGSSMAWMVVAIVFLIIALSTIVLTTVMGYLLYKKTRVMENSNESKFGTNVKNIIEEGKVSGSMQL